MQPILADSDYVVQDEIPLGLPPIRVIHNHIDFVPGSVLPNIFSYRMIPKKHEKLKRQVDKLLERGFIKESMSLCVVPALLVSKKDGSWRMCVDSMAVNKITVEYRFSIPRLNDLLLDQLYKASIFSKIDMQSGYHQFRMRLGDKWNSAFNIRDGLFEWMVITFSLSNAFGTFMQFMNHILKSCIGVSMVVYFDDIFVYIKIEANHLVHLHQVFSILRV